MIKKIRLETSTSMNFNSADKCGFSLRSEANNKNGDWAIDRVMDKLLVNSNNVDPELGRTPISAIPADKANVADLEGACYQILGQPDTQETIDARAAGKPVYTVIQTLTRVFEYVPGRKNTGGAEASIAGLGDVTNFASADSNSPLV